MECDDDLGIDDDSEKTFDSSQAIVKEARAVYNQLKMLHFTLKGSHDSDSGTSYYTSSSLRRLSAGFSLSIRRFAL